MSEKGMGYYGDKISQLNNQLAVGVLCLICSFCELILAGDYKGFFHYWVSAKSLHSLSCSNAITDIDCWHCRPSLKSTSTQRHNIKILHGAMKLWHSFTWAKCSSLPKCFQVDCCYFDKYRGSKIILVDSEICSYLHTKVEPLSWGITIYLSHY